MLTQYLEDLEQRIDPALEEQLTAQWRDFLEGTFTGALFCHTVDKGIKIIGFDRGAAEAAVKAGRSLHGCVHCS